MQKVVFVYCTVCVCSTKPLACHKDYDLGAWSIRHPKLALCSTVVLGLSLFCLAAQGSGGGGGRGSGQPLKHCSR